MSLKTAFLNSIPDWMVLKFSKPYLAGDSLQKALEKVDELWAKNKIHSTLDVLGEEVDTPQKAQKVLAIYKEAAASLKSRPQASLSIKPSHFGFHVDPSLCENQVGALAAQCEAQGIPLTIDMEDVNLTQATVDLYRRLKPEFPCLGLVLQSRLFRTAEDFRSLEGLEARVRLCIGIYNVSPEHGLQKKKEMKAKLLELLPLAFSICQKVEIATHDKDVVRESLQRVNELKIPSDRVEFQMLLGVPRNRLHQDLLSKGYTVRLYVPFAQQWKEAIAYLRRRLLANPAMAALVLRNLLGRERG